MKTLASGVVGAVAAAVGVGGVGAAARLRGQGAVCSKHADCESGACYPKDRTGRRTCGPNLCQQNQVSCKPIDECHVAGACEPTTGVCTTPPKADGDACDNYAGACSGGVCELFATFSCSGNPRCQNGCPSSADSSCSCGTTIEGDPICFRSTHGCAGHMCGSASDCTADYGASSVCISGFCSTPASYCASSGDCGDGSACVNRNGGCGGCDAYTGGLGICNVRCTS